MIPLVQAIRRILFDNVQYEGNIIKVIKRSYPKDETPCITVDDSGGSVFMQRDYINEECVLRKDHPQYDPEHPFMKQPQEVLRETHEGLVNVHVWCDDEFQREEINKQVKRLFQQAQSDYYIFCDNYSNGHCAGIDGPCAVDLCGTDKRGVKGQCPNPELYHYKNVFDTYNIIRASFRVDEPFTVDDLSKTEPVLHSIFRVRCGFHVDHLIGGHVSNKLKLNTTIIEP